LIRVVLDTNVLISACLKPEGLEARVARMAVAREVMACVTPEVWGEYEEVLGREKFRAWRDRADALLADLRSAVEWVAAAGKVSAAADEDDNRFLECAETASADFLISGTLRHYPAEWAGTRMVNARGFLNQEAL
jgi:putative PIN family toxin of toxin-antitoxin system